MTTFWITKYTATGGLFSIESEAKVERWHGPGQFSVKDTRENQDWFRFTEKEAFTDKTAALADADARRLKKIDSLKKQIAKIEKLREAASGESA